MVAEKAETIAADFADERALPEDWDFKGLSDAVFKQFNFRLAAFNKDMLDGLTEEGLAQEIIDQAQKFYDRREEAIGRETMRYLERVVMLQTVDNLWKDHLLSMDHLKEGIGLRGYAQQDPLLIYKKEGFEVFQQMIERIKDETLSVLFRIQLAEPETIQQIQKPRDQELIFSGAGDAAPAKKKPMRRNEKKIGRNAPCPCGSGKKYKKCCGK